MLSLGAFHMLTIFKMPDFMNVSDSRSNIN